MKKLLLTAMLPLGLCACASMAPATSDILDEPDGAVVPGRPFRPASSLTPAAGLPAGLGQARIYMDQDDPNIQQLIAPRTPFSH